MPPSTPTTADPSSPKNNYPYHSEQQDCSNQSYEPPWLWTPLNSTPTFSPLSPPIPCSKLIARNPVPDGQWTPTSSCDTIPRSMYRTPTISDFGFFNKVTITFSPVILDKIRHSL